MQCIDCDLPVKGKVRRGRCENCYRRHLRKLRNPNRPISLVKGQEGPQHPGVLALRRVVRHPNGCWLYQGPINPKGYGDGGKSTYLGGRRLVAHRAVYEFLKGPIPPGLELDHLCHTRDETCAGGDACQHRRCINPDHLELVTPAENNARSNSPSALNARKTQCIRGHEFTPENTYWQPNWKQRSKYSRQCRECYRLRRKRLRRGSS